MSGENSFVAKIPLEELRVLLELTDDFGVDPTASAEIENFFVELLRSYSGSLSGLAGWLRPKLAGRFRCLSSKPRWIQNPNWQVSKNGPMIFVGQVDIPSVEGLLHDQSSFYVFFDPETGECRTVMQIA